MWEAHFAPFNLLNTPIEIINLFQEKTTLRLSLEITI